MRIRTDISPMSFQKEMWLFLNCPPQFLLPFLHLDASFEHLGFWPVLWCNLVSGQDHGKVRKKQPGHRALDLVCTSTVFQRTFAHVVSSHEARAVFAAVFEPALASVSRVFCSLWFVSVHFQQSNCSLFTSVLWLPTLLVDQILEAGELPPPAFLRSWASCAFLVLPFLTELTCGW